MSRWMTTATGTGTGTGTVVGDKLHTATDCDENKRCLRRHGHTTFDRFAGLVLTCCYPNADVLDLFAVFAVMPYVHAHNYSMESLFTSSCLIHTGAAFVTLSMAMASYIIIIQATEGPPTDRPIDQRDRQTTSSSLILSHRRRPAQYIGAGGGRVVVSGDWGSPLTEVNLAITTVINQ